MKIFLTLSFVALMVGRVVTPVEEMPMSWHLIYETLSHFWVGSMMTIAALRYVRGDSRVIAGALLVIASLVELVFFLGAK
jgi:hypothetical protein